MAGQPGLDKQGKTEAEFLAAYDASRFQRPSVTVDMLIFTVAEEEKKKDSRLSEKSLQLLLIKRGGHPYLGQWALPGGFVEIDESLDDAASRELREETNLEGIYMEQLYTWGEPGRDPRTRVISTAYLSLVDSTALEVRAKDDADDAKWFTVSCRLLQEQRLVTEQGYQLQKLLKLSLTNEEVQLSAVIKLVKSAAGRVTGVTREIVESSGIAFDHAKIIEYGIERLRNKIDHTEMVFHLMPERFTLTELQQVYGIILDKELEQDDFRRKIAGMVTETEEYTGDTEQGSSRLFRFNPKWIQE